MSMTTTMDTGEGFVRHPSIPQMAYGDLCVDIVDQSSFKYFQCKLQKENFHRENYVHRLFNKFYPFQKSSLMPCMSLTMTL